MLMQHFETGLELRHQEQGGENAGQAKNPPERHPEGVLAKFHVGGGCSYSRWPEGSESARVARIIKLLMQVFKVELRKGGRASKVSIYYLT